MRIVVFSDSHNNYRALEQIVLEQPQADYFLHLGDGEREFDDLAAVFPEKKMLGVCGNCDWGSTGKVVDMLRAGGRRIFFAHGHTFHVKSGIEDFIHTARSVGADIALYGHTHVACKSYEDGLYIMNPGSVTRSHRGPASYGIVDITAAGAALNIVPFGRGRHPR